MKFKFFIIAVFLVMLGYAITESAVLYRAMSDKSYIADIIKHEINRSMTLKALSLNRIAHAGGGFNSMTYTNSIDALNLNSKSYDFFELDFRFTSDGYLVCTHDWDNFRKRTSVTKLLSRVLGEDPASMSEFELWVDNQGYKSCTYKTLITWLDVNADKKIVTDVKESSKNLKYLEFIAKEFPNFQDKFIPQIYFPEEYEPVRKLGYKSIIWTLYRYKGSAKDVLEEAKGMDLYAITMPVGRAQLGLAHALRYKLGIPSYVHTINAEEEYQRYKLLGIEEIYTDWLPKR